MKNLQLMEDIIDERVERTLDTFRVRYACTDKETDLADWIRYVASCQRILFERHMRKDRQR